MSLRERIYSVLVVSSAEKLNTAFSSLLPESRYSPVRFARSISAARRDVNETSYDFIIINSPLPDDPGIRFAIDRASSKDAVILLLVRADLHDEIYDKVFEHGIFTLPKPFSSASFTLALSWMASFRERLRRLEEKTLTIEEKMEEIRLVNRAKWLLISELKMEEPQAHHYIEKQAMDRAMTRKKIAEEIIRIYK